MSDSFHVVLPYSWIAVHETLLLVLVYHGGTRGKPRLVIQN